MRPAFVTIGLAAALVLAPARSRAQSTSETPPANTPAATPTSTAPTSAAASDPQRAEAREHFARGVELIHEARWLDAITELQAARDIRVTPPVLFNLGLAQRAVGRNRDAIVSFQEFLRLLGPGNTSELATQAQGYIRELSAGIGRLELRITPPGAVVQLDGAPVQTGQHTIDTDPGRHVIQADATGYATQSRSVEVRRGATAVVVLNMVPTVEAAQLHVESNVTTGLIRIDDNDVGYGTADENVRPGRHTIEVRAPGHSTFIRAFDAVPGTRTNVRAVLTDERSVFVSPYFWVGTVVVVAAAVVAGFVLFSSVDPAYRGSWGVATGAIVAGEGR